MYQHFRINRPHEMGMLAAHPGDIVRAVEDSDFGYTRWTITHTLRNGFWDDRAIPNYGINEVFVEDGRVHKISEEEAGATIKPAAPSPKLIFNPFQIRDTALILEENHPAGIDSSRLLEAIYEDIVWLSEEAQGYVDATSRYGYRVEKALMLTEDNGCKVFTFEVLVNAGMTAPIEFVEGTVDSEGKINVKFPRGLG